MNLDEIDGEVRESLGAGTLDAVRSRSRRNLVRRRAGLAGVTALVAVAAAVAVPYAFTGTKHSPNTVPSVGIGGPTVQATGTAPSAATVNTPDRPSRVPLVSGDTFASVRFPLTPTFTPAGLPAPTVGRMVYETRLVYAGTGTRITPYLVAAVSTSKEYTDFTPPDSRPITINGDSATLYTSGGDTLQIIWKLHTKWVSIYSQGVSVSQAERYARGLTEHPMSDSGLPLTLALVPQGYVVSLQDLTPPGFSFRMAAPRAVNDPSLNDALDVASTPELASAATGTPVQVGNYPGKLNHDSGRVTLYVLRPGFIYAVSESDKGPLSNADLIRFAAGISPK